MKPDRDAKALAIRNRIGVDAKASLDAFEMICDSLEAGEPLPPALASFLASALRRTSKARSVERAQTLTFELGLSARAKIGPPSIDIDYWEARELIERDVRKTGVASDTHLKNVVADHFGISPNTALKHVMPAALIVKMLILSEIDSLVPHNPCPRVVSD